MERPSVPLISSHVGRVNATTVSLMPKLVHLVAIPIVLIICLKTFKMANSAPPATNSTVPLTCLRSTKTANLAICVESFAVLFTEHTAVSLVGPLAVLLT